MEQGQTTEARKSKALAAVTVSVLIAALGAGGSVYVYEHLQKTKSQQDFQAQINMLKSQLAAAQNTTPTMLPSPAGTPDPATDWKTYTSSNPAVSFKYPSDWSASKKTLMSTIYIQPNTVVDPTMEIDFNSSLSDLIKRLPFGNQSLNTLEPWLASVVASNNPSKPFTKYTKTIFAGHEAFETVQEANIPINVYYIQDGSNIVRVSYNSNSSDKNGATAATIVGTVKLP